MWMAYSESTPPEHEPVLHKEQMPQLAMLAFLISARASSFPAIWSMMLNMAF